MTYLNEPPFAMQIELVEGCNLRCAMCGLQGIRKPGDTTTKEMTPETLESVLKQAYKAGWNPRIEFAMHGEPTLHSDYVKMIAVARKAAPDWQLMMTSNGGGLLRKPGPLENISALFNAGLNILALDDYQTVKIVPKIRQAVAAGIKGVTIHDYPADPAGNPHVRGGKRQRKLVFIEDINVAASGTHSSINNHAGAGAPLDDSQQGKRCAKPFREMSVRWDGNVAICCNDWRGTFKAGNILDDGIENVWNGEAMQAARRFLYHGRREFGPCKGCNAVSHRVGLLPDRLGRDSLPEPDKRAFKAVERACSGKPYTKPVLRPWEKKSGS